MGQQLGIGGRGEAAVHPFHAANIDGFADVVRRSFLAGVGREPVTLTLGSSEEVGELRRRMIQLRSPESHAHHLRPLRADLIEQIECFGLPLVSLDDGDDRRPHHRDPAVRRHRLAGAPPSTATAG